MSRIRRLILVCTGLLLAVTVFVGIFNQPSIIPERTFEQHPDVTAVTPTVLSVVPEEFAATPETLVVTPSVTNVNSETMIPKFVMPLFDSAFAIPSTQNTVTLTRWAVSGPNDVAIDSSGAVFFTEGNNNKIGRLVPSTNTVTEWANFFGGLEPRQIAVHSSGDVYFLAPNGIERLVPGTNTFTRWTTIPQPGGFNLGMAVDSTGDVYSVSGGSVIRLATSTNAVTSWAVPGIAPFTGLSDLIILSGNIYFTYDAGNKIGKLEPSTNTVTLWSIPTPSSLPKGMTVDSSGNIYFTESATSANKIGRLVPGTNTFTEWSLPTLGSGTQGIAADSSDNIYFEEGFNAKIGRLVPGTNTITEWSGAGIANTSGVIVVDPTTDNVFFTHNSFTPLGRLS